MDVLALAEGFDKHGVGGKVRHNSQLDLRIVRGEQQISFFGDERRANLPPQLAADGNVLQVRVGRAEPARRRARLAKAGVQAPCFGMNQFRQRIDVR